MADIALQTPYNQGVKWPSVWVSMRHFVLHRLFRFGRLNGQNPFDAVDGAWQRISVLTTTHDGVHYMAQTWHAFYGQPMDAMLSDQAVLDLKWAFRYAAQIHMVQSRKDGRPYWHHLLLVWTLALWVGADVSTLILALLHDVAEDVEQNAEEVYAMRAADLDKVFSLQEQREFAFERYRKVMHTVKKRMGMSWWVDLENMSLPREFHPSQYRQGKELYRDDKLAYQCEKLRRATVPVTRAKGSDGVANIHDDVKRFEAGDPTLTPQKLARKVREKQMLIGATKSRYHMMLLPLKRYYEEVVKRYGLT